MFRSSDTRCGSWSHPISKSTGYLSSSQSHSSFKLATEILWRSMEIQQIQSPNNGGKERVINGKYSDVQKKWETYSDWVFIRRGTPWKFWCKRLLSTWTAAKISLRLGKYSKMWNHGEPGTLFSITCWWCPVHILFGMRILNLEKSCTVYNNEKCNEIKPCQKSIKKRKYATTFCHFLVLYVFLPYKSRGTDGWAFVLWIQIFHQNVLVFLVSDRTDRETDRQTDAISMFWAFLVLKN